MTEGKAPRVWRLYLLLGVLSTSGYFFIPSATTRELAYNVVGNIVGISTVAAVLFGARMYRPVRPLPWHLFVVGLLLLVAGDVFLTISGFLGSRVSFPSLADALFLAFYPFMIAGMSVRADKKPEPHEGGVVR